MAGKRDADLIPILEELLERETKSYLQLRFLVEQRARSVLCIECQKQAIESFGQRGMRENAVF